MGDIRDGQAQKEVKVQEEQEKIEEEKEKWNWWNRRTPPSEKELVISLTMKLQDYRNTFYEFSGKASDVSRQLGFAAIALIWLFKKEASGEISIPAPLLVPGLLVVASLSLDLLQYMAGSTIWRLFYRSKEKKKVSERRDMKHSPYLELPITILLAVKLVLMVVAYIGIGAFFVSSIRFG